MLGVLVGAADADQVDPVLPAHRPLTDDAEQNNCRISMICGSVGRVSGGRPSSARANASARLRVRPSTGTTSTDEINNKIVTSETPTQQKERSFCVQIVQK